MSNPSARDVLARYTRVVRRGDGWSWLPRAQVFALDDTSGVRCLRVSPYTPQTHNVEIVGAVSDA